MFKLKNVQIFKIFKFWKYLEFLRKKKKRKTKRKPKNPEKKKEKPCEKRKNLATAALTGRPNVAPTRAERGSAPLTGGA
jgi:hypothetical protein